MIRKIIKFFYQTHAENRSQLRLPAGVSHNVSDEQRKRYLPLLNTAGRDTGCGLKQTKKERKEGSYAQ